MAQAWQAFPSGIPPNGVNAVERTWVDPPESIGEPGDAPATSVLVENSAFALAKGMLAGLGVAAGSGGGDINDNAKVFADPIVTLGTRGDAPATGAASESASAISLLKGILAEAGI